MNILLPVDGSPLSLEAVHHAIRLVRDGLKADFLLANVQPPSSLYEMVVVHDAEALRRLALAAGEHVVERAAGLLNAAGIEAEVEIASGDPAHTLVDIVERFGCNAVIMGAHGEGEASSALGSVAQSMLRNSPVPVMIVRPPQEVEAPAQEADSTL
jgi:nucleotide-binding universal stress UspA family protein